MRKEERKGRAPADQLEGERAFGRLEGRVDELIRAVEQDRAERRELDAKLFGTDGGGGVLTRMSSRIGSLERWRSFVAGALAAIAAAVTWVTSIIGFGGR